MKEKITNKLLTFITNNKDCSEKQIKTIKYGLNGLYSLITKLTVVLIIVIILNSFLEFLYLLISYMLLRTFSFGLHSSKGWICWVWTIVLYVGGSLLIKYIDFNNYITLAIWIISFISFILWAPADTPKRPLIRAKQRKTQKIKTCIITILFLIIIIFVNVQIIKDSITLALLIQSIMVNPLAYYITKTPFNNYKYYKNKV